MANEVLRDVPTELIIGGEHRAASDGATFDVIDPATGDALTTVASGTVEDAIACVDAASAAASEWASTAPRKRSEILHRTYQLMVDRADDLARLITAENGKALPDARGEVLYSAEFFRWYAEEAVRIRGDIQVAPGGANKIIVLHQPVGVARPGHPVELPGRHGRAQDRPGAGRRLHRHPEAGQRDPADRARHRRPDGTGRSSGRGGQRAAVEAVGGGGLGDARRPARSQAVVHRLDRSRPHADESGQRAHRQLLHGARRQRAVRGLRRRRPRCRARGRDDRQDAQRRRGLYGRQPVLRRRIDRRRVR